VSRVAIIPARGGSRRIPGKNIREFHGKPIICYSIETALRSRLFDAGVWVSTEDPAVAHVAWANGAKVHPRQKTLSENNVGTQDVMRAVLNELYPVGGRELPLHACCIYATAPMMTASDLRQGFGQLAARLRPYLYTTGQDGKDAGQWYWGLASAFANGVALEGNSHHYGLPEERTCDINTLDDWIRAERLYAALHMEDRPQ
jgi:N-acylneuraminate cytidylyltransferase